VYVLFDFALLILKASNAKAKEATSLRLCPASVSNDSELLQSPAITSTITNAEFNTIPQIKAELR
jgi:hypothetical protein